jgi:polar amino acid transport system substrate-binding protein
MKEKKWILWGLLMSLLVSSHILAKTLEIIVADYPPYVYQTSQGEVQGVWIDLTKQIFQQMNQPIHISLATWSEALKAIKDGRADAIFAYKTPEREEYLDFSSQPLALQTITLFALKKSLLNFTGDLNTLRNDRLGIIKEMSYGSILDQAIRNDNFKIVYSQNLPENNAHLIQGKIDILAAHKHSEWVLLKKLGLENQIVALSPDIQQVPSYLAFSKAKNLTDIKNKFDQTLNQMKNEGTYQKIFDQLNNDHQQRLGIKN